MMFDIKLIVELAIPTIGIRAMADNYSGYHVYNIVNLPKTTTSYTTTVRRFSHYCKNDRLPCPQKMAQAFQDTAKSALSFACVE